MSDRPFVISIAGLDPTAGAGLLSDIKCFEAHGVYGFGICSSLTVQTDTEFLANEWLSTPQLIAQLEPLLKKFPVEVLKIGLIKDLDTLLELCSYLHAINPEIKIIADPILKATAGYKFHEWNLYPDKLKSVLKALYLITPNYLEMESLGGSREVGQVCESWSADCAVLLKGGHHPETPGTDYLYLKKQCHELPPGTGQVHQKHGSGCVLSAAITAQLALGFSVLESCRKSKQYTEQFLNSNTSLLGYHNS